MAAFWFKAPVDGWPDTARLLTKSGEPWPEQAAIADLRWHEFQEKAIPGRPTLRARWAWTDYRVRTLLADEDCWKEPMAGSRRQRTDSGPPAVASGPTAAATANASNPLEIASRRQRTDSGPTADLHTRVDLDQTERDSDRTIGDVEDRTQPQESEVPDPRRHLASDPLAPGPGRTSEIENGSVFDPARRSGVEDAGSQHPPSPPEIRVVGGRERQAFDDATPDVAALMALERREGSEVFPHRMVDTDALVRSLRRGRSVAWHEALMFEAERRDVRLMLWSVLLGERFEWLRELVVEAPPPRAVVDDEPYVLPLHMPPAHRLREAELRKAAGR